ncbi:hypothetical protein J1N35_044428 [Gossypium stocksii]|uniref:FAD-binding domain-containing protein n=1 Tax=Gossypium stocksii TaxID=47602 RepID=A0A9D3ZFR2_9ROSI|nr:hypothetical protein J1N35_044428 [Gossypium stocksii]
MNVSEQEQDIVIVGGGICGLATALALRRKGIKSMVLERSETLRAAGVGIIMQPNGWRALDQLGVAAKLRQTCTEIPSKKKKKKKKTQSKYICQERGITLFETVELMKALTEELPVESVYLGCRAVSILLDPLTSNPLLQLHDGTVIKAKIVIGCDGVNSIISNFVGVNSPKLFSRCSTRGFTYCEGGHSFGDKFRLYSSNDVTLGQLPVTDKLVYWFLTRVLTSQDLSDAKKDPTYITKASLEAIKGFLAEIVELVKNTEPNALYFTELRCRAPWDLGRAKFRKGTVVVAGDAMHAMCPFISQGGGASLEDALVLARCLSEKLKQATEGGGKRLVEEALDEYVRERRMRVFWLSLQTYFIGLAQDNTSKVKKALGIAGLILVFGDQRSHTEYDCGRL